MRAPYRVIAITGASSGLGAALAMSYAGPGVVLGLIGAQPRAARADRGGLPRRRRDASRAPRSMSPRRRALAGWLRRIRPRPSGRAADRECRHFGRTRPGQPRRSRPRRHCGRSRSILSARSTRSRRWCRRCARAGAAGSSRSPRWRRFAACPTARAIAPARPGLRAYAEALRPRLRALRGRGHGGLPGFFSSPMTDRWEGPTPFLASRRAGRPAHQARHRPRRAADRFPVAAGARHAVLRSRAGADRRRDPARFPFPDPRRLKRCGSMLELLHIAAGAALVLAAWLVPRQIARAAHRAALP